MRDEAAIAILEAAYRLDLAEGDWLQNLGEIARDTTGSVNVRASVNAPSAENPFFVRNVRFVPYDEALIAATAGVEQEGAASAPAERMASAHLRTIAQLSSDFAGSFGQGERHRELFEKHVSRWSIRDTLIVQGTDLSNQSLVLTLALAERGPLPPRRQNIWNRVAVHLSAALRLRNTLEAAGAGAIEDAGAIFEPSGKCVHAANGKTASEELKNAAMAVDRARGRRTRDDPEAALDLWRGLFAGRWSIVEAFDTDDRRFLVAHENDPAVREDRALTRREKQVAGLAALGLGDGMIGYSLGLAEGTIRTHLKRAMRKMGIASRHQLVEIAASLVGNERS